MRAVKAPSKDWSEKREARQKLIDLYRQWQGPTLPQDVYYWTLGGKYAENGLVLPWREFDHVVYQSKLIKPEQWICVEGDPEVWEENQSVAHLGGQCLQGNIISEFVKYYKEKPPGIINLDSTNFVKKGCAIVGDILQRLISRPQPCFVCWNIIRAHIRYKPETPDEEIISTFRQNPSFDQALRSGKWELLLPIYSYGGTGNRSKSLMNMLFFFKK